MDHFRLSSVLLLTTACSLLTAVVSAQRVITCGDSRNVQLLSCDTGVISVHGALYGRTDREICSENKPPRQLADTNCSQEGTLDVVKRRCDGKSKCEFNINDVRKPDPCRGIFKYLDTNYTCLPAIHRFVCEHSLAHLYCDKGQVIFVYGADYGRRDPTTCAYKRSSAQLRRTDCSSPTSKVAERCNGRNSCKFRVGNKLFGDPCKGTAKYLEVAYICEYPGVVHQ